MNDALFWQLIARLGHDLQPNRLVMALTALPAAQFLGFGWYLREAAAMVDGPVHRRFVAEAREHRLPQDGGLPCPVRGATPAPQEVQMTVVALGRDVWTTVVATPSLLSASWPCDLGRQVEALTVRQRSWPEDLVRGA